MADIVCLSLLVFSVLACVAWLISLSNFEKGFYCMFDSVLVVLATRLGAIWKMYEPMLCVFVVDRPDSHPWPLVILL